MATLTDLLSDSGADDLAKFADVTKPDEDPSPAALEGSHIENYTSDADGDGDSDGGDNDADDVGIGAGGKSGFGITKVKAPPKIQQYVTGTNIVATDPNAGVPGYVDQNKPHGSMWDEYDPHHMPTDAATAASQAPPYVSWAADTTAGSTPSQIARGNYTTPAAPGPDFSKAQALEDHAHGLLTQPDDDTWWKKGSAKARDKELRLRQAQSEIYAATQMRQSAIQQYMLQHPAQAPDPAQTITGQVPDAANDNTLTNLRGNGTADPVLRKVTRQAPVRGPMPDVDGVPQPPASGTTSFTEDVPVKMGSAPKTSGSPHNITDTTQYVQQPDGTLWKNPAYKDPNSRTPKPESQIDPDAARIQKMVDDAEKAAREAYAADKRSPRQKGAFAFDRAKAQKGIEEKVLKGASVGGGTAIPLDKIAAKLKAAAPGSSAVFNGQTYVLDKNGKAVAQ